MLQAVMAVVPVVAAADTEVAPAGGGSKLQGKHCPMWFSGREVGSLAVANNAWLIHALDCTTFITLEYLSTCPCIP